MDESNEELLGSLEELIVEARKSVRPRRKKGGTESPQHPAYAKLTKALAVLREIAIRVDDMEGELSGDPEDEDGFDPPTDETTWTS